MGFLKKLRKRRQAKKSARRARREERRSKRHARREARRDKRAQRRRARIEQRQSARKERIRARLEAKKAKYKMKGEKQPFDLAGVVKGGADLASNFLGNSADSLGDGFSSLPLGLDSSFSDPASDNMNDLGLRSVQDMPKSEDKSLEDDTDNGYWNEDGEWVEFNAFDKILIKIGLIKKQD